MRVFSSPILLLTALLVLFGLGRFTYSVGQIAFGKEEEVRAEHLRQAHLAATAKALLQDGREAEAKALLERASASRSVQYYVLRREDKVVAAFGDSAPRSLTTAIDSQVEAGPFALTLGASWSWRVKLAAALAEVGQELFFLVLAGAAVLFSGTGMKKLRRPRSANSVRILREMNPEKVRRTEVRPVLTESEAFECTLLRVQVGSPANRESALLEIGPTLELARAEILDAAGRYGGELAGSNGHEFVCYFRDSGDGHSALTALGAARDLREHFHPKKISTHYALAHGFARLIPEGADRKLVGAPFLEVSRLAASPEQIVVTERVAKFAVPAVKFKTKDGVIAYTAHAPLADVLERARRSQNFSELDGFHADAHLTELLRALPEHETELFVGIGQQLRRFAFQRCSTEARDAFKTVLRGELKRADTFRLSTLIALAASFYTRDTVDEETYTLFLEALASTDRRVKSNTIQLFIQVFPDQEVEGLKALTKNGDHRISANALIKQALERFDERVVRTLYGRVRGGSVAHVASALFAVGEIAQHYRTRDPILLKSKTSFLRLFDEVPFWVKHPNPMVRRQALGAARKLADPELDEKLRAIFQATQDQELLALFAGIYDWHKGEKPASSRRTA